MGMTMHSRNSIRGYTTSENLDHSLELADPKQTGDRLFLSKYVANNPAQYHTGYHRDLNGYIFCREGMWLAELGTTRRGYRDSASLYRPGP
jgi:hypothetical protein